MNTGELKRGQVGYGLARIPEASAHSGGVEISLLHATDTGFISGCMGHTCISKSRDPQYLQDEMLLEEFNRLLNFLVFLLHIYQHIYCLIKL